MEAKASPEKRLFISLITRDITLVAAFLDLIDNSINATIEPISNKLLTAADYDKVLHDPEIIPEVDIILKISENKIEIKDTAPGISAEKARDYVFKFGAPSIKTHTRDRLSVYGIGLKRAIFKLGNRITMHSDHVNGGFALDLNVKAWEKDKRQPWVFDIARRTPVKPENAGTAIIKQLHDDVKRRVSDGVFLGEIKSAIADTYAYYLKKFVNIYVNNTQIQSADIEIGSNYASDEFTKGSVSCKITAGIGIAQGGSFKGKSSGWFVFCNGRALVSADKSPLTGWGGSALPTFQPKHRPFLGTVFFVSEDPEQLPWATTKSHINEDSSVWQEAKRRMVAVGRQVISFLDNRYTDEGTEIATKDLQEAAGDRLSVLSVAVAERRVFEPPKKAKPNDIKIQYQAKVEDVERIEKHLGRPGMGGAEVGRHTFYYFLRNEVGEE